MKVERIFIRPPAGGLQQDMPRVRIVAGAGIEGDRYFGCHDEPGQNVTFIEAEEIEAFMADHGRPLDWSATGRNFVTRGVRLNTFVGCEFVVGAVRFVGVELCEPCLGLGEALASPDLPPAQVVRRWVRRAGLRATALTDGMVETGAPFGAA